MAQGRTPGLEVTVLGVPEPAGQTFAVWGQSRVLVKRNDTHQNVTVNEFLANRLAISLGIPVPMGDIWLSPDLGPCWVTAAVREKGIDLPPATSRALSMVPEPVRARMVCFDALILNNDRSDSNVLVDGRGHAWLIDHEQSFFGPTAAQERARGLRSTQDRRYRDFCSLWTGPTRPSARSVENATRSIRGRVMDAAQEAAQELVSRHLITAEERDAVVAFVSYRRDNMATLLDPATFSSPATQPLSQGGLFDAGGEDQ